MNLQNLASTLRGCCENHYKWRSTYFIINNDGHIFTNHQCSVDGNCVKCAPLLENYKKREDSSLVENKAGISGD